MTTEERLQRIEHVTAGLADQALGDREESGSAHVRFWRLDRYSTEAAAAVTPSSACCRSCILHPESE